MSKKKIKDSYQEVWLEVIRRWENKAKPAYACDRQEPIRKGGLK
jgi:hypothetical protein